MNCWPFSSLKEPKSQMQAFELETKMADHVAFAKRVRKSLYYGEYSDASLPSLSATDVAVEVLNSAVPPHKRILDRKYAQSVARRAKISPCAMMLGMLYAERLHKRKNSHPTKTLSSSEMFLISIMVASKYLYDEGEEEEVYNEDWAKAGLKNVQDLNKLEMDFLRMMDWNLFISKEEFSTFVGQIESRIAVSKGLSRGWLTYHDMSTVLSDPKLLKILLDFQQQLLKIISSCLAAYILGVSILFSSSSLPATMPQTYSNTSTTVAHSAPNCITTDAACLFTRNAVAPGREDNIQAIASRRQRSAPQINSKSGLVKSSSNSSASGWIEQSKTMSKLEIQKHVHEDNENQTHPSTNEIRSSRSVTMTRPVIAQRTLDLLVTKTFTCALPSNHSNIHKALLFSNPCYR